MRTAIISLVLIMGLIACKQKKMELTQKEKAVAFIKSFETGSSDVLNFIDENIKSHNYTLPNGKNTYEMYFTNEPSGCKIEFIRIFEDKEFVIMHNKYTNLEGYPGPIITFDIVRFENGKIAEHWDNIALEINESINGNSQTDGAVIIKDISLTEKNKAVVSEYMQVMLSGEFDKIAKHINGENYIQHNSIIDNGVSGVLNTIEKLKTEGIDVVFNKVHRIFAEGNFVLAIVEGSMGDKPTSFYDLFRIENGQIVEHWDILEEIQASEDWQNTNGKFHF
ncbi:hypothetical protein L3049_16565 [Labilibaculum sp. DW002]|uniref:SnoaL-like domain-containing protein n=1 Tax=Paralabilibaculum antarcticum TaxID=2912572 RepID=A0ABT5VW07_9BACT|nr:hypothetical protein [Labilibaculum sp. DW002]MDE5419606.1 hypothetical protein [Labilibaculum sp. DW002]